MVIRKKRNKTGPKPLPVGQTMRNAVMVRFDDQEYEALKARATPKPLAVFVKERALANG